jgi:hypothetical protein
MDSMASSDSNEPCASGSEALGPAPRAELLRVLMLPDLERAERIGEFWGYPQSRAFAELLIDREEDRTLRACSSGCCGSAARSPGRNCLNDPSIEFGLRYATWCLGSTRPSD